MRLLVHIPARAGSKGVPGKNLRTVWGESLVASAVRVGRAFLRAHGGDGQVFVDTDGTELAEEARRRGAFVPFLRDAALAGDRVSSVDTVLGAVARLEALGERFDGVVLLQPTSPLRTLRDVQACFDAHRDTGTALTVAPLAHPIERTLELDGQGTLRPVFAADAVSAPRQAHAQRVTPNGAVYAISLALLREGRSFFLAGRTHGVAMPPERSIDIDTELDFAVAEALAERAWRAAHARGLTVLRADAAGDVDEGAWAGRRIVEWAGPEATAAALEDEATPAALLVPLARRRGELGAVRALAIRAELPFGVVVDDDCREAAGAAIALGASVAVVPATASDEQVEGLRAIARETAKT